jgi:hypothetical protein
MLAGELYRTIREFIPADNLRRVAEEWADILDEFGEEIPEQLAQDAIDPDFEEAEDNAHAEGA